MNSTAILALVEPDAGSVDDESDATYVLADEVREVLLECGFTTAEVDGWVDTYTRRSGSSDADAFLDWMSTYRHHWVSARASMDAAAHPAGRR